MVATPLRTPSERERPRSAPQALRPLAGRVLLALAAAPLLAASLLAVGAPLWLAVSVGLLAGIRAATPLPRRAPASRRR